MFARVAVINRGEPAIRLFRAVRELNEERGYGIKVIAFHTESEQRALEHLSFQAVRSQLAKFFAQFGEK